MHSISSLDLTKAVTSCSSSQLIYVPGQKCDFLYDLASVYAGRLPKMGVRYLRKRTIRAYALALHLLYYLLYSFYVFYSDHLSMVLLLNEKVIGGLTFRHLTPKGTCHTRRSLLYFLLLPMHAFTVLTACVVFLSCGARVFSHLCRVPGLGMDSFLCRAVSELG